MPHSSTFYCRGYVSVPLVEACQEAGLFTLLDKRQFRPGVSLSEELDANVGYFTIALDALVSLGWLEKNVDDCYRLAGKGERCAEQRLSPLYAVEPDELIAGRTHERTLADAIEQLFACSSHRQPRPPDPAQGAVLVPMVVGLQRLGGNDGADASTLLGAGASQAVTELFVRQQWLSGDASRLTPSGKALLRRSAFGIAMSYRPVLQAIPELLFGDHERAAREIHRAMSQSCRLGPLSFENVGADVHQDIADMGERESLEHQLPAIVDATCHDDGIVDEVSCTVPKGNGGRVTDKAIRLVGAPNGRHSHGGSGPATVAGFIRPPRLGEVTQPRKWPLAVEQLGVVSEREVLHLHRFVDGLVDVNPNQHVNQALRVLAADQPARYLNRQGRLVDAPTVLTCWQQHLRGVAQSIDASPLAVLEAHAASASLADVQSDECDPWLVEWLHRLAHEYLITAEAFVILAAGVGLFNDDGVRRYPRSSGPCRISLHRLVRRDYIVRHATETDLDRLYELEKVCWRHTRTPRKQIRSRLRKYPHGQFVLEKDGWVLGAIYSQRIASVDALTGCTAADVHTLHDESGSIVQLLAVNIDPQVQNVGYGDQLLEFMLNRCSLMTGVERVVGVTLCKNYQSAGAQSFDEYIRQRGRNQDPVLAFHDAHGAAVVGAIPGYRPQDRANLNNGVLVSYDSVRRPRRAQSLGEEAAAPRADRVDADVPRPHRQRVSQFVRAEAAGLLAVTERDVDFERPLMEMGLDSADLLKLQRLCEGRFGLQLETGFFFEYNTVGKVVDHLAARVAAASPEERSAALVNGAGGLDRPRGRAWPASDGDAVTREVSGRGRDIGIIGMSCKLPGGIETPDDLWRVLSSHQCVVGSFPRTRGEWPSGTEYPGIDRGGFVSDADAFDAAFFRISPAEAEVTDPQQRMLLELAWACLENAGIMPSALKGSDAGVFVGASNCDYSRLVQDAGVEIEAHNGVGSSLAILANRLSYFFDLSGPSLVVDTACSSSLVALHSAVQSLRSGECSVALVGGVNLICHPDLSIAYHKAGMLAPDGRCKVFDAAADGYVRAEGAVVVLLKPLRAAIADGHRIHAVIRGSATNHGGLAGGLTVPNPQKQKELLVAAWKDAGVASRELTCIEAHGTGTSLGDPIELQGIQAAFAESGSERAAGPCAIGSVKSNIGHLESAAGLAGLLKVVLSLEHRQLPGSVNFRHLNPKIQLADVPCVIEDRLREWDAEDRLAGVSSFGSGGANAHIVVQQHVSDAFGRGPEQDDHLFVLSAANDDRLRAYVARVIEWLEGDETARPHSGDAAGPTFGDAIFTWQAGRTAMKYRLAARVKGHRDLLDKLRQWAAGETEVADLWQGQAGQHASSHARLGQTKSGRRVIDQAVCDRDFELLGTLWVEGTEVDWHSCHAGASQPPRIISLPTYPFARDRFWIDTSTGKEYRRGTSTSPDARTNVIHPLLHIATSDPTQHSYGAILTGEELFLSDHRVRIDGCSVEKVLPAVVYLEMVRAAIEQGLPTRAESTLWELRNTAWAEPLVVTGPKQIWISLSTGDERQIGYEIYSDDEGRRAVHCQGRAVLVDRPVARRVDLDQLESETRVERLEPTEVYAACARMGLVYGPAFQAIAGVDLGHEQLLVRLRLPGAAAPTSADYVLHPSVTDGALQACVGWIDDWSAASTQPRWPFALESARILEPCTSDMVAWVRCSSGTRKADRIPKLDIDLCDVRGNVCVELHGLSSCTASESLTAAERQVDTTGSLIATPVWKNGEAGPPVDARRPEYSQHHVVLCDLAAFDVDVDVDELESLLPGGRCLRLHAATDDSLPARYTDHALSCFELIRTILQGGPQGNVLVQIVAADHPVQTMSAGLVGLLRTAALENPRLCGQVILVAPLTTTGELARRLQDEKARPLETLIRHRDGVRQVLQWQEVEWGSESSSTALRDEGVYVITGGLGGLGLLFARAIIEQTRDARVVLTGRSAWHPEKQAVLDSLPWRRERVAYRQLDLLDRDQAAHLVRTVHAEYGPIVGILHSAGMIADDFILKKSSEQFRAVLLPKVAGTVNLDEASRNVPLDFFVLFSSIAAALGNLGQADYAAANGFMDQFAAYRNGLVASGERHGRTRAINWPLWRDGGMGIDPTSQEMLRRALGIQPMQTATGLRAFHRSLALPHDQMLVAEGDLVQIRRTVLDRPSAPSPPAVRAAIAPEVDAERLADETEGLLCKELSSVLQLPVHKIDPHAPLREYGIDSILALKLTSQLEQTFGTLPKTLFFEYQTIRELRNYFVTQHSRELATIVGETTRDAGDQTQVPVRTLAPVPATPIASGSIRRSRSSAPIASEPIAIIGLSGRYPESVDLEAFWENLRAGKDCIREVPPERWNWREHFSADRTQPGHHYSKWGGFIAGVDAFDPVFFNIAPRDAKYIDPQERLFLQHAWMAIEDAGYTRAGLQVPDADDLPGQVGVYVGVMWSEYQLLGAGVDAPDVRMGFAGNLASIANRVSYVLNVHGPSLTLDTMCSSSLSAIHMACQDLKAGRTSLALAGGVNVTIHPNKYLVLSAGQFISSAGQCQSFGEGGDGYIPGEGVGVVVLKRLSEAARDGDHIYGVIRGSALTHGGKTNGYTVPNPHAQASAIRRALTEAQLPARAISYLEAHGTGTKLGDPIEIAALTQAFQRDTADVGFCRIGSVKSNIGHGESAAGIAGLTKVLLQLQHEELVPSLHAAALNPHIDFDTTPFVVQQTVSAWARPVIDGRPRPRVAGISSFGAGGSNAHLIVEEYVARPPVPMPVADMAIVLSARTQAQLQQKARDLVACLAARRATLDLRALAYTLQVGREAMDVRVGVVVRSVAQLIPILEAYGAGAGELPEGYASPAVRDASAVALFGTDADLQQTIERWLAHGKLGKVLALWVTGVAVDWRALYESVPSRISLPTYPFATERYWIETGTRGSSRRAPPSDRPAALLHPLLHTNISDLHEHRYETTFREDELVLVDYQVDLAGMRQRMLPAMAFLEMARAAVTQALPERPPDAPLTLQQVVWTQPVLVTAPTTVRVAVAPVDDATLDVEIYREVGGDAVVYAQARAVLGEAVAPAPLDLAGLREGLTPLAPATLYATCAQLGLHYGPGLQAITAIARGETAVVAELQVPPSVAATAGDYTLHPSLLDGALQTAVGLLDAKAVARDSRPRMPLAVDEVRIVAPLTNAAVVWVRHAPGRRATHLVTLDIDLCDAQGAIAVQMRGLGWQTVPLDATDSVDESRSTAGAGIPALLDGSTPVAPSRREIAFVPSTPSIAAPPARRKPAAIALPAPSARPLAVALSSEKGPQHLPAGRPAVRLADEGLAMSHRQAETVASPVRLFDCGDGAFAIEIASSRTSDLAAQLLSTLRRVQQEAVVRVLTITGLERGFVNGDRVECNDAIEQGLFEALVSFPCPVVAVLHDDATGAAFLAAALCDVMVCDEDARYGYTSVERHLYPTGAESIVFGLRFGDVQAQDVLYSPTMSTGRQLRAKGWTCAFLPSTQLEAYAQQLASTLATNSQDALRLLKAHLTRGLVGAVATLAPVDQAALVAESQAATVASIIVAPAEHIRLDTAAQHVLVVTIGAGGTTLEMSTLAADLGRVVAAAGRDPHYKAIVLASGHPEFLPALPEDEALAMHRLLVESSIPVVAALPASVSGHAWFIAQTCDAAVYSRPGSYSAASVGQSVAIAQKTVALFTQRFGHEAASEILLTGAAYPGSDLQQRAGGAHVAEPGDVMAAAVDIASTWARLPRATLADWKRHTAATLDAAIYELTALPEHRTDGPVTEPVESPTAIALRSAVVKATAHREGVVVVEMVDRAAKNLFTAGLRAGLAEAFAAIAARPGARAVVLTGFDQYFASGGTQETLRAIYDGTTTFMDDRTFEAAATCGLPVVAAVQGHGIGAGWTLGLLADVVVHSAESQYVSPYVTYGFTPGAGATDVVPARLGVDLGRESLLTGTPLTGRALQGRGVRGRVVPRREVLATALALARQIAQHPAARGRGLKAQLTAGRAARLAETYRRELAMHDATFVGRAETWARIERSFDEGGARAGAGRGAPAAVPAPAPAGEARADFGAVTATLKTLLARELQLAEADITEGAPFVDLGLDSISGVTWVRQINATYQTTIDATTVYRYPTLTELSRYVATEAAAVATTAAAESAPVGPVPAVAPASVSAAARAPVLTRRVTRRSHLDRAASPIAPPSPSAMRPGPIAVIGMAGQFPQAPTLDAFWQNLAAGRDCITPVARHRWDVATYYQPGLAVPGKTTSQWLGALADYDRFDPLFFNLSPTEAESMDPQQRLFLQACWHCVESAGYAGRALAGQPCGVFVGCAAGDYQQLSRAHQLSAHGFTGNAPSILAARIAYLLNLQGPCLAIDTACSSSLVALAQACDSLTAGTSAVALAGGVYVMVGPDLHIKTAQAGMLSPDGRCATFDHRANGFVPGEGVGVVLLKRLAEAERDGDRIYGVLAGWGVNQDGKTNGITAPNPAAQARLMQTVYARFGIDAGAIQLVEAHGTGTPLGDPIEVAGLRQAFAPAGGAAGTCALGSVKSNIGHCLAAAGVAGVLKLLLALQHRQLPPTLHVERLNPHIDLTESPFYVNTELRPWPAPAAGRPRLAATSSFGFSGTNAHVVVGEYLAPPAPAVDAVARASTDPAVVLLSARTPDQLRDKARDLHRFLVAHGPALTLADLAYTLQVGRDPMDARLAFLAHSLDDVTATLQAFLDGHPPGHCFHGQVNQNKESISIIGQDEELKDTIVEKLLATGRLGKLAELWVKGLDLDWSRLHGEITPQRIGLPLYPFAKQRYWIDTPASGPNSLTASAELHPLMHQNTSNFSEQRYSSIFTGEEFFLTDHRVRTDGDTVRKVLPGVAYLEMARAAAEQASDVRSGSRTLELHDTVWLAPVVAEECNPISISLAAEDDDNIGYEIYSLEDGQRRVHCQGWARFGDDPAPEKVDVEWLAGQMTRRSLDARDVYATFATIGLHYGPAHRAIVAIHLGDHQLLAHLRVPAVVESGRDRYVLHPSLMDGALQASIGLITERNPLVDRPYVPFAVERLCIVSACAAEMTAWVRLSDGGTTEDNTIELDIDLYDTAGNVCVQLEGLVLRALDRDADATRQRAGHAHAGHAPRQGDDVEFDESFYRKLAADIARHDVSIDEAVELG